MRLVKIEDFEGINVGTPLWITTGGNHDVNNIIKDYFRGVVDKYDNDSFWLDLHNCGFKVYEDRYIYTTEDEAIKKREDLNREKIERKKKEYLLEMSLLRNKIDAIENRPIYNDWVLVDNTLVH